MKVKWGQWGSRTMNEDRHNVIDLNEARAAHEAPEPTFEITQTLIDLVTVIGAMLQSPPPHPTPAQLAAAMDRLRCTAALLQEGNPP